MKTVTETAKMLGVTRQTILNWIDRGVIKAFKPTREYRITEEEIQRLIKGE